MGCRVQSGQRSLLSATADGQWHLLHYYGQRQLTSRDLRSLAGGVSWGSSGRPGDHRRMPARVPSRTSRSGWISRAWNFVVEVSLSDGCAVGRRLGDTLRCASSASPPLPHPRQHVPPRGKAPWIVLVDVRRTPDPHSPTTRSRIPLRRHQRSNKGDHDLEQPDPAAAPMDRHLNGTRACWPTTRGLCRGLGPDRADVTTSPPLSSAGPQRHRAGPGADIG
jgi:hypothetical protein